MKLESAVKELFECDVEPLRAELAAMPPEIWEVDGDRQKTWTNHRHTRSIRVVWLPHTWRFKEPVQVERYSYVPPGVREAAESIGRRLETQLGGTMVKLLLAELSPGGRIAPHTDMGDDLTLAHRCHVPVVTNEHVHMMVDGRRYRFATGRAYEFDNTRFHGVINNGATARVHLICDIFNQADAQAAVSARGPAGDLTAAMVRQAVLRAQRAVSVGAGPETISSGAPRAVRRDPVDHAPR